MSQPSLKDFDITIRNLSHRGYHECHVISKTGGTRYGIIIQSMCQPPVEWVFAQFVTNPKAFFVDIEVVIEEVPVEPALIPLVSGSSS
jgi:hypothetical protein